LTGLRNLISLQPGEGTRTLILFFLNFCVVAITVAGKTARDTVFLSRYNKTYLPLMFIACAATVALAASTYSRLSKRWSRTTILDASSLLFAVVLALIATHIAGLVIPFLYVWTEVVICITAIQVWLIASDTFDPRQAKRLFGIIGGGGSLAAAVIGTGIKPFVHKFGANTLLLLIIAAVVIYWILGRVAIRNTSAHPVMRTDRKPASRSKKLDPYLLAIAALIGLSAMVGQLVDYQFKIFAAQEITNERDLAGFFGNFYAATGIATLVVQFFLTSVILSRLGLIAGMLALPMSLNIGSLAILLTPRLWSGVLAKFSDQTLKYTLNSSSLELLWLPVRPDRRKAVRPLISGTVKYTCEVAAGCLMLVLVRVFAARYLAVISLALIVPWLIITFRLKKLYVNALVSAIEKRQIDFEDLAIDAQDPTIIAVIEKALRGKEDVQRLFALELLEGMPLSPWRGTLADLFETGSPEVKNRILGLAAGDTSIIADERLVRAIREEPSIGVAAMELAAERRIMNAVDAVTERLGDADPDMRASAASTILRLGHGPVERGRAILRNMIGAADAQSRKAALRHAGSDSELVSHAELSELLNDGNPEVREAALQAAAARRDEACLPAVISALGEPRLAPSARKALSAFDGGRVTECLAERSEIEPRPSARRGILRALGDISSPAAMDVLIVQLRGEDLEIESVVASSLRRIGLQHPIPQAVLARIKQHCETLIRYAYICNRKMSLLSPGDQSMLVREHLQNEIGETVAIVLRLSGLEMPAGAAEQMIMIVRVQDRGRLPYVMEFLENHLDRRNRDLFTALLNPIPPSERDTIGAAHYQDLPTDVVSNLTDSIYSHRAWVSAISADYLNQTGRGDIISSIDWERVPDQTLAREALSRENGTKGMFSTLEKTILLKSVSLFSEIPAEKLSHIAQVAEETHWPAGSVVLREGDPGDALFIVADGAVRVHKGNLNLATLQKGDCLGEMAVLDQAPRSADATAVDDTTLLKISQEDFYEVLAANPEITERIVRLLTRRLREANEKLAAKASSASQPVGSA
jgi:ATP/ADP translocase/HEAT repeat protein